MSYDVDAGLNCLEAETVRFARRRLRPFSAGELAGHLRVTEPYARRILRRLVDTRHLIVASGNIRYRTYRLNIGENLPPP